MLKLIRKYDAARWGSTFLVSTAGAVTAFYAQHGMNPVGWAGAALTLTGAFTLAATLRTWGEAAAASRA